MQPGRNTRTQQVFARGTLVPASLRPGAHRGFSLAEMMIALVILGLGLLFIASLLPVGVEYSRQTNDQQQAQAAVDYAFEMIEHYVRTSDKFAAIGPAVGGTELRTRMDSLFRPRRFGIAAQGEDPLQLYFDEDGEPRIKVRPLIGMNIDLTPDANMRWAQIADQGEGTTISGRTGAVPGAIGTLFSPTPPIVPASWAAQVDPLLFSDTGQPGASLFENPVLPSIARIFPPVSPDSMLTPNSFFDASGVPIQSVRRVSDPFITVGHDTRKAAERRLVWLALYRRAFNDRAVDAPKLPPGGPVEVSRGDPLLYEFIVVVVRRTSASHRFPMQLIGNPATADNFAVPIAATTGSTDRLIPEPWLVCIDPRRQPQWTSVIDPTSIYVDNRPLGYDGAGDRFLVNTFIHPNRWSIEVNTATARLLPPGSVLIPAVNDYDAFRAYNPPPVNALDPMKWPMSREAGFIPSDPDVLPIYKILERVETNSGATLVIEGNGIYPWYDQREFPSLTSPRTRFVCWVIPPAFTERDASGQPVFERRSPIVTVARRTIRVPEVVVP